VEFYNGSTLIATKTTAPYTFTWQNVATGTYTLTAKATDNMGLSTTATPDSVIVTDLVNMQLAPNPVGNILYITIYGLKKDRNAKITILSNSGSVIKTLRANTSETSIKVDVSSLHSGIYTVQFTSGFVSLSGQIVKL